MSWESVQICEDCWFEKTPDREPIRVIEKYRDTEPCFDCDTATSSGIFVRRERP